MVAALGALTVAFLHGLESLVESLGLFESGLKLDALVGAAFPASERSLTPERLHGVAQVARPQLGHAVRVEPVVVAERAESEGRRASAARDVPEDGALLVERSVVVGVDVVQPLADARRRPVALDPALQLVGYLDLDPVDVLLGEQRRQLLVHSVEQARFTRQGRERNETVGVRLDHPLDRVGEQPPHVLHALLIGRPALHLRPEDFRWPFAEGFLNNRARVVGNAVEFVHCVVDRRIQPDDPCLLSLFLGGEP